MGVILWVLIWVWDSQSTPKTLGKPKPHKIHIFFHRPTCITMCNYQLHTLARLRQPPAAFLLNRAITRGANGTKTFPRLCQSYMQSFIKIGVLVFEKNGNKTMTLCNFNKDKAFTRFTKLLIELTRTLFFRLSNESKRVHLFVIKLEHPIFGFKRSNI